MRPIHVLLIISCYDWRFAWSTSLLILQLRLIIVVIIFTWLWCHVLANIEICPFWALWRFTIHLSFLPPDVTVTDTDTDADRTANSGAYDHDPRHDLGTRLIHIVMLLRSSSLFILLFHVLYEEYSLVVTIKFAVIVAAELSTDLLNPLSFALLTRFAKIKLSVRRDWCKILHLDYIC